MQKDSSTEKKNSQRSKWDSMLWALNSGVLEQDMGICLNQEDTNTEMNQED